MVHEQRAGDAAGVFLSHTWKDKGFVRRLAGDLRAAGVRVWLDEAELTVGDSLIEKIRAGIDEMEYLAVVLTPQSVASEWVKREVDIAMSQEIEGKRLKVLPLMLEECALPGFLQGKVYADFAKPENYDTALAGLLKRLGSRNAVADGLARASQIAPFLESRVGARNAAIVGAVGVVAAGTHSLDLWEVSAGLAGGLLLAVLNARQSVWSNAIVRCYQHTVLYVFILAVSSPIVILIVARLARELLPETIKVCWAGAVEASDSAPRDVWAALGAPDGIVASFDTTGAQATFVFAGAEDTFELLELAELLGSQTDVVRQASVLAFERNGSLGVGFEESEWVVQDKAHEERLVVPRTALVAGTIWNKDYASFFGTQEDPDGVWAFMLLGLDKFDTKGDNRPRVTLRRTQSRVGSPDIDALGLLFETTNRGRYVGVVLAILLSISLGILVPLGARFRLTEDGELLY